MGITNGLAFLFNGITTFNMYKTDTLPAIEVKEHKSVNNPTEAEIIAEVLSLKFLSF